MTDAAPVSFTLDLEDYWLRGGAPGPIDASVDRLLACAAAADSRGTVFVVGDLAARRPDLVRRCAEAGHEMAIHGYVHTPIDDLGADGFRADIRRARATVEDITGQPVAGYRAPLFSITAQTPWAPDILRDEGFAYSSSVLPAASPIRGFPGAPRTPFRWTCGLVELPCPIGGLGPGRVPYLGGVYLRYLPMRVVRRLAARAPSDAVQWLYCHPYDVDTTGVQLSLPHAGRVTTRVLSHRRRGAAARITSILGMASGGAPLAEHVARLSALPEFGHGSAVVG